MAVLVGEVIGVGIFLTPAAMAKSLGSPLLILAVWLFIGGTALCGALCLAELGSRYPEAGGPYVYLREAFGPLPAFLYGWKCMLVMDAGLTATYAAGMTENLGVLVPLSVWGRKLVAVAAVLLVAGISLFRLTMGATVVRMLTWAWRRPVHGRTTCDFLPYCRRCVVGVWHGLEAAVLQATADQPVAGPC